MILRISFLLALPGFVSGLENKYASCLSRCARQTRGLLGGKYTTADEDPGDYDYAPDSVKYTRKTCRVLAASESCAADCQEEWVGGAEFNATTLNFFGLLCNSKTNEWRDAVDGCLADFGVAYQPQCHASCSSQGYSVLATRVRKGLAVYGKTGESEELTRALDSGCRELRCLAPCQADFYKAKCGDREVAQLILDSVFDFMHNMQRTMRLWDGKLWPQSCQDLSLTKLRLPSEVIATTRAPFAPVRKGIFRTAGVAELVHRITSSAGSFCLSVPVLLFSTLIALAHL